MRLITDLTSISHILKYHKLRTLARYILTRPSVYSFPHKRFYHGFPVNFGLLPRVLTISITKMTRSEFSITEWSRFVLRFIHSHSAVFWLVSRCMLPAWSRDDRREYQDRRSQAESEGFTNKNITTLCNIMSRIPCSRSVVINVPVTRQWRHVERIQFV